MRRSGMQSTLLLAVLAALLVTLAPGEARSQVQILDGPLPPGVASHLLELANRPDVLVMPGQSRIPPGTVIRGDVVVLGGNLSLGGAVEGELAVINGSLELEPGATVAGPVHVVGGRIAGQDEAVLRGPTQVFSARLQYRRRGDRLEPALTEDRQTPAALTADLGFGQSRLTVRAGGPYNRVEGQPLEFGPIVETPGANPLTLEAFGIWRSEVGFAVDTDRMGYRFSLDQAVGGRGTMSVGAEAYSQVRSLEDRGMSNVETALSTFLRRVDYRDHLETTGWSAYFQLRPLRYPLSARATFREEEHETALPGGPWTLGDGDEPWRLQPAVAVGTARYLDASVAWDTRDDPERPTDGWWIRLQGTRQVGGSLRSPFDVETMQATDDGPAFPRATFGTVDLRRYARLGRSTRVNIRLFASGAAGSSPLPPQFQVALGGEGSLPGHPRFAVDCGARSVGLVEGLGSAGAEQAFPAYGCERTGLAQLEFQRDLPFTWDPIPDAWDGSEWAGLLQLRPTLSVFLNAGRGWTRNRDGFVERGDSPSRSDVGLGLTAGSLGVYWAYPLNQNDRGLNFFVRLNHRF